MNHKAIAKPLLPVCKSDASTLNGNEKKYTHTHAAADLF